MSIQFLFVRLSIYNPIINYATKTHQMWTETQVNKYTQPRSLPSAWINSLSNLLEPDGSVFGAAPYERQLDSDTDSIISSEQDIDMDIVSGEYLTVEEALATAQADERYRVACTRRFQLGDEMVD